jgi:acetyltransferase-like isoleucine patch superfamily enzyme
MIFNKIYRKNLEYFHKIGSILRHIQLKLKYPDLKIIFGKNSFIGKNCSIICVDGGKMILKNAHINNGCHIFCGQNAELIIDSSFIGMNSVIVAKEKIIINKHCEIAEMTVIRDQNHKHDHSDTPIAQQGMVSSPIIIGSNVWIGAKATILQGVNVGKNSIIGANAVVTKSIPEKSTAVGVPAKILKSHA